MPSIVLSDNGVSSGSAGLKTTAASDGALALQTTTAGGTATTAVTIGTDQSVTFAQAANLPNTFGFKNRIINGGMVIDQRNAGASVNPASGSTVYTLDRWAVFLSQTSKLTIQRSSTAPAGFNNSLLVTSSSAYSVGAGEVFQVFQNIEGFNVADLGWGAAGAATVNLSFWVRSSLTGTFGGSLCNSGQSRIYPFSYTISAANTWEQKTITIAGDTTGTWLKDNSLGIGVILNMGNGTNYQGATGAWTASTIYGPSGGVNVVGTNGATFYITGVQLEKGSTATSFDYRPYGTELQLCQRYYAKVGSFGATYVGLGTGVMQGTTIASVVGKFPVSMRSTPTIAASATSLFDGSTLISVSTLGSQYGGTDSYNLDINIASGGTTNRACTFVTSSSSGFVSYSAEL